MAFENVRLSRSARPRFEALEARVVPANLAPTIAQAATAVVDAAAKTAELSVLGADDGGEQNLRYTWYAYATRSGVPAPTLSYPPGLDGNRATVRGLVPGGQYGAYAYVTDAAGLRTYNSVSFNLPDPNYRAPTIAQPARAVASSDGASVRLSVLGADDGGEAKLNYSWSVSPYAPLEYSYGLNGDTATARPTTPGTYTATARITDGGYTPVSSSVTFTVAEIRQPLSVSPPSKTMNVGTSFGFDAVYRNQFGGIAAAPRTATTWTLVSGPGTVDAAGVFTAPATPGVTVLKATADGAEAFTTVVTRDPGTVPARTSHTLGEQKVLVVQWVYADSPGTGNVPISYAEAFKRSNQVDAFFRQQSFNKTSLNFTFVPVSIRLDYPKAHYENLRNFYVEANEAVAKAATLDPSFNRAGYDRVWFATTPTSLGATGRGQLGGKDLWIGMINGRGYHIHEFAHTYGLNHSHEDHDIGNNISVPSKIRLGWVTATDTQGFSYKTLTSTGTHRLYPESSTLPAADGQRAFLVAYAKPGGGTGTYTLSYNTWQYPGLLIHEAEQDRLDPTPGTGWQDAPIAVGSSYVLPNKTSDGKTVRITVLAAVPAAGGKPPGLDIKVEFLAVAPPVNRLPVAVGDSAATTVGTPVTINVVGNDTDPDGHPITLSAVGTAANGTVAITDGRAVYTPKAGFSGTDTFTYTIGDGHSGTATGTVNVTVAVPVKTLAGAIAADNSFEVYLNGAKVGTGSSWTTATLLSKLALRPGANVLAVRAVDVGGVAGLIADLTVGGVRVGTSAEWKVAKAPSAGWEKPEHDDSGWVKATEYGGYGVNPWGRRVNGLSTDSAAKWIWTADALNDNEAFFRVTFVV